MYEFLRAAFPFVIVGIAVAFLAANHKKIKSGKTDKEDSEEKRRVN